MQAFTAGFTNLRDSHIIVALSCFRVGLLLYIQYKKGFAQYFSV
jgi:hypothetical protein